MTVGTPVGAGNASKCAPDLYQGHTGAQVPRLRECRNRLRGLRDRVDVMNVRMDAEEDQPPSLSPETVCTGGLAPELRDLITEIENLLGEMECSTVRLAEHL